jgi:hypothetical protein
MPDPNPNPNPPDPAAAAAAAAAEAAKGNPKPAATSALGAPEGDAAAAAAAATAKGATGLPENWREQFAGGDADALKELQRFTDPAKIGGALLNYKKNMRSGSFDVPPPPADKPEELKAWREAHGIPVEVTGYKVPEPIQKRLFDEDKPILEGYIAEAHKKNQPQSVIDFTTEWYVDMQEKSALAQVEADKKGAAEAEDALRTEWGQSYTPNFNMAKRAMKEVFPGVDLTEARLPDGRKIGSVPGVVKGLQELALAKWGAGEFIGTEATAATQTRIQQIEEIIRTKPDEYTPAVRQEYFKLLDAQSKKK